VRRLGPTLVILGKAKDCEMLDDEKALVLWRRWFEYSGDPYEGPDDYGDRCCFFCGNERHIGHAADCIYLQAKMLIKPLAEENDNATVA